MMITNLPSDLVEEIFSRVPLKPMRAVRLTCRNWNTLSKGHFGKASPPANEGESQMIVMMEDNLYSMSVFDDLSIEHKGKLTCLDQQAKISHVFHCDGLLLCILKDDDTKVVVWNPYLGQTSWIEIRYPHVLCEPRRPNINMPNINMFSYTLGYEDKRLCRNYKVLRFIDFFCFKRWNEFVWYELYDFDSGLWTTLDVSPYWRITSCNGVSLNGNTYWCATKRKSDAKHIICFDYTRERLGPLLPLPNGMGRPDFVTLSCVREEKVAVLCAYDGWYSIWITTRIEAEKVSWSKFWEFYPYSSLPDGIDIRLSFRSFYVDEVKKVGMFFGKNGGMFFGKRLNCHTVCIMKEEDGHAKLVDLEERTEENCLLPQVCSYVPSLVQIKQPQRGKKQCNLEKLRYDEMMSRLSFFKWRCKTLDRNCSM